jgi:hypothetical protein
MNGQLLKTEDEVSFQAVSIVFQVQVCSLLASVLLYSCNRALWLWRCDIDIDGKRYRSNTLDVSVWTCATWYKYKEEVVTSYYIYICNE